MRKHLTWILIVAPVLGMSLINILNWSDLPARIPIHWDFHGQPDSWGGKTSLWLLPFLFLFPAFLITVPMLRPGAAGDVNRTAINFLLGGLGLLFLTLHSKVVLLSLMTPLAQGSGLEMLGLCAFMILTGFSLLCTRRNPWLGVRTPWALASEENWNRTHRLTGRCFIAAGTLMLVFYKQANAVVFLVTLLSIILVSFLYSWHFKRNS